MNATFHSPNCELRSCQNVLKGFVVNCFQDRQRVQVYRHA
jgi:hypothetical protein